MNKAILRQWVLCQTLICNKMFAYVFWQYKHSTELIFFWKRYIYMDILQRTSVRYFSFPIWRMDGLWNLKGHCINLSGSSYCYYLKQYLEEWAENYFCCVCTTVYLYIHIVLSPRMYCRLHAYLDFQYVIIILCRPLCQLSLHLVA